VAIYRMQFHAEREELVECIAGWVGWHGLSVVVERFFPEYEPVAIAPNAKLRDAIVHLEPVRRICLARGDLYLGSGFITTEEFMTVNPDCLAIALEPVTEDGLRETALATLTSDRDTLAFWLQLVLELDEIMHEGATVIDPRTGRHRYFPSHRHTPGAHELAEKGVRMLACAGDTYFEFADVDAHEENGGRSGIL
jgi:hypothetical protein